MAKITKETKATLNDFLAKKLKKNKIKIKL
ncbi:hypothetical protein B0H42_000422 [Clostridium saccharobutylicum]|nr:hypothetical protein [Clostridium saccharobutylicum]